ncbi:MAG: hypothetical protein AVDCRST_MAG06-1974, partial [uncultured Nocardioides sp.]
AGRGPLRSRAEPGPGGVGGGKVAVPPHLRRRGPASRRYAGRAGRRSLPPAEGRHASRRPGESL